MTYLFTMNQNTETGESRNISIVHKDMPHDIDLQNAYEQFRKMTLLDDRQILDDLYCLSTVLKGDVLFSVLQSCYMRKYHAIMTEYKSVQMFVTFVCYIASHHDIKDFKQLFIQATPDTVRTEFVFRNDIRSSYRKRTSAEPVGLAIDTRHPFLRTDVYNQYEDLFNIGRFGQQLVPWDFAPIVCSLREDQIKINLKQNSIETVCSGIRGKLKIPVLCMVSKLFRDSDRCVIGQWEYLHWMLEKMTGLPIKDGIVNLGIRKDMKYVDLMKNNLSEEFYSKVKVGLDQALFAVVDGFTVTGDHDGSELFVKAYTPKIYGLRAKLDNAQYVADTIKQNENMLENCCLELDKYDQMLASQQTDGEPAAKVAKM